MNIVFFHLGRVKPPPAPEEHPVMPLHQPPHDLIEGSEFLDDAIHMDEVLVTRTEISVSAGSPQDLL
jgi:hypothetical protein